jgi:hypothetical protein
MADTPKTQAFDNVKGQIGCCGIWCGSCVVGNGALRQLSENYKDVLKNHGLHEWGPDDVDWSEFYRALDSIAAVPVCPGCLKGGGRDKCEMRACASNKGLEECVSCSDHGAGNNSGGRGTCKHAGILEHMRSGAIAAGLFVKTDDADKRHLTERWTADLRKRWQSGVLFMNEG